MSCFLIQEREKETISSLPISIQIHRSERVENLSPTLVKTQTKFQAKKKTIQTSETTEIVNPISQNNLISSSAREDSHPVLASSLEGVTVLYPRRSVEKEEEGEVLIQIDSSKKLLIHKSSKYERLDKAAMQALQAYDFSKQQLPMKVLFRFSLTN